MTNTIDIALRQASAITRLDAELLLASVLKVSRSYLYTWPDKPLIASQQEQFQRLLSRRLQGEPVAYLLGKQEFWSLELLVTDATLIPRPETELLVELALKRLPADQSLCLADLGTGSGAVALALAKERPNWHIDAVDSETAALAVAQTNANRLAIGNVCFYQGNWCQALPGKAYHAIISNPPYIAATDPHLHKGDVRFEPKTALVSGKDGLNDCRTIIVQAAQYLESGGLLMLEHGYNQAEQIARLMQDKGFSQITSHRDFAGHARVTECSIIRSSR